MPNSRKNKEESIGLQHVDHFFSLGWRRDQEHNRTPSIRVEMEYTGHTNRSQSRTRSHVSHEQEIDHLQKKLRRRVHVSRDRMPS